VAIVHYIADVVRHDSFVLFAFGIRNVFDVKFVIAFVASDLGATVEGFGTPLAGKGSGIYQRKFKSAYRTFELPYRSGGFV